MSRRLSGSKWVAVGVLATLACWGPLAVAGSSPPCQIPDNGTGTIDLLPLWSYYSPDEYWYIIDGLPPGTTMEIDAPLTVVSQNSEAPGGSLGGQVQNVDAILDCHLEGTGELEGLVRTFSLPLAMLTHSGPRTPGDPVQSFPMDVLQLNGMMVGDPDFDQLQITAGTDYGLPSPGQTTLTRLGPPGSDFAVDSFFDISYQIDFVGAPGGALADLAGSTVGTIRVQIDPVPEPATFSLLAIGVGCAAVVFHRRRRRR